MMVSETFNLPNTQIVYQRHVKSDAALARMKRRGRAWTGPPAVAPLLPLRASAFAISAIFDTGTIAKHLNTLKLKQSEALSTRGTRQQHWRQPHAGLPRSAQPARPLRSCSTNCRQLQCHQSVHGGNVLQRVVRLTGAHRLGQGQPRPPYPAVSLSSCAERQPAVLRDNTVCYASLAGASAA